MLRRLAKPSLLALVAASLLVAGCNGKQDAYKFGKNTSVASESTYLDADGLTYQVQISRAINPSLIADGELFRDLPPGTTPPSKDEEWFGVWLQVSNQTGRTIKSTPDFEITDTLGNAYKPLAVGTQNVLAYNAQPILPHQLLPLRNSIAFRSASQGAFLLFKLPYSIYQNRPADLHIQSPVSGQTLASVELDL